MKVITQAKLRSNMKKSFDEVTKDKELLIVKRSNDEDIVILSLDEYNSMMETVHLLKSNNNRNRLLEGIKQANEGKLKKLDINEL